MATKVNPRSITDAERPWLEAWSLPVQVQLLAVLRDRIGDEVARNLFGWLGGKYAGQELASMPTRASYRKILRELAADGITPDPATVGSAGAARRNARRATATSGLAAIAGGAVALALLAQAPRMSEPSQLRQVGDDRPVQLSLLGVEEDVPDTCIVPFRARPRHVLEEAA